MAGPVDWALAERVAIRFAGREPLATSYLADSVAPDLMAATQVAEDLVAQCTGLRSLAGPARARVVDRADWIRANLRSFRRLLRPLLDKADEKLPNGPIGAVARATTGTLSAIEIGTLLGILSQRVLGQYDLLVLEEEEVDDQDVVYFVGPNLLSLEKRFGFPPSEFRLWIALHEVTHRAQFTGVPWMRDHFLGLVHSAIGSVEPDAGQLLAALRSLVKGGPERDQALAQGGLLGLVATAEQREVLGRIGGLMSLLEGHGDVTMDRAGEGYVPSAERFSRVLRERRKGAPPLVKLVQKLTGMEAKLAQYEQGERFIARIEEVGGSRAIDRCWTGPAALPTLEEIREPERWIERVGLTPAAA